MFVFPCLQTTSGRLLNVALQSNGLVLSHTVTADTTIETLEGFENDGEWYSLEFTFNSPNITISVSDGSFSLSRTVDYFISTPSPSFNLILGSLSAFGSAIPQTANFPITEGFEGCVRNAEVDRQPLSLDRNFSANYPTVEPQPPTPSCPREEVCNEPTPCLNNGMCVTSWDGYSCDCTVDYEGENCSEGMCGSLPLCLPLPLPLSNPTSLFSLSLYNYLQLPL